jgi:hypothetical protein
MVFGLDWQQRLRFVLFRSCKYTMIAWPLVVTIWLIASVAGRLQ